MEKGERIQYACGHWLVAGEFGIQDDYAKDTTAKRCGTCWHRIRDAAPAMYDVLKKALAYGPNLSQAWFEEAREAIKEVNNG